MGRFDRIGRAAAAALLVGTLAVPAAAETLKASHQWPSGTGDFRDEMIQIIAKELKAANVDLDVRVFPGSSLVKPREQWAALSKGQIDISLFPLDYAAGKHPQFSATLMPGLVKNHEHSMRLSKSPFMDEIKKIVEAEGIMVIADGWLAGGFASKKKCILNPADAQGQVMRAAGPMFEKMLAGAGASLASMPSSEIYTAMQTGVLDGANTSSESFNSYRLQEQVKCMTPPGDQALWFMYEPLLMSKRTFDKMNDKQKQALLAAAKKAEDFGFQKAKEADAQMVETFKKAGVEIVYMTAEQAEAWRKLAQETSYKTFATEVPGGKELIDKALAVK